MVVVLGLVLSGCGVSSGTSNSQESAVSERPEVTLKGTLIAVGEKFFIKNSNKTTEVTSRKIDLKSKVGTEVEVFGEFSGTTLFIDALR